MGALDLNLKKLFANRKERGDIGNLYILWIKKGGGGVKGGGDTGTYYLPP